VYGTVGLVMVVVRTKTFFIFFSDTLLTLTRFGTTTLTAAIAKA